MNHRAHPWWSVRIIGTSTLALQWACELIVHLEWPWKVVYWVFYYFVGFYEVFYVAKRLCINAQKEHPYEQVQTFISSTTCFCTLMPVYLQFISDQSCPWLYQSWWHSPWWYIDSHHTLAHYYWLSSNPVTYLSMALYYWSVFGNCSLMVRANCTFFGCIPCITHQFLTGLFQNSLLVYFSSVYWFHPPLLIGLDLGKYC